MSTPTEATTMTAEQITIRDLQERVRILSNLRDVAVQARNELSQERNGLIEEKAKLVATLREAQSRAALSEANRKHALEIVQQMKAEAEAVRKTFLDVISVFAGRDKCRDRIVLSMGRPGDQCGLEEFFAQFAQMTGAGAPPHRDGPTDVGD